jgi:hypothetical protein
VVIGLAGTYGLVLRLRLLAHTPVNSDWAVAGLMAKSILSGHFWTFYWGQQYGGVEPYLVAPVVWLSGGSPWAMGVTAALLSAVAAVLVGLVVGASTGRRWLGWAAGTLAWVWPYAVVWNSIREYGFRGVTMACGLLALWMAVRIHRGPTRVVDSAVLGLAIGIGWWSSPELVYFAAPVAVVLVLSWDRLFDRDRRLVGPWRLAPVAAAVASAVVGALPWLYTNVGTGFASLQTGSLPSYRGLGYGARLHVFFDDMLPVQLGVRTVPGGAWVGGRTVGPVLYGIVAAVVVVVVVAALGSARRGRAAAPALGAAAGIVLFPFLYALVPSTGYWVDGRYGVYLPAFIAIAAGVVLAGARPAVDLAGPPPDLPSGIPSGVPSHVRGHRAGAHRRHRRRRGAAALAAGTAGLVAATVGLVGAGWRPGLAACRPVRRRSRAAGAIRKRRSDRSSRRWTSTGCGTRTARTGRRTSSTTWRAAASSSRRRRSTSSGCRRTPPRWRPRPGRHGSSTRPGTPQPRRRRSPTRRPGRGTTRRRSSSRC